MSLVRRVLLLGLVLACAGSAVLIVNWARKPELCLLYSNLSPTDAGKISDKLRDAGTPYEIRDGGASLYVPQEKVYALRLAMAQQGLTGGDQAGYRILDEERMGASPFTQQINYTRALEGELAKSIRLLEGVLYARVHVVRPERTVFAKQEKQASATVVLQLKSGARFASSNASAIVALVAGAVEDLSPDKVVVVDSQGNVLSGDGGSNDFAKGAGTMLDYKNRVEGYLSRKAEDMLSAVLGPNRSSVKVDVVLETSSLVNTKESYAPDNRVVTKEKVTSSTTASPGPQPMSGGKDETTESTYLAGKTVEQKTVLPGSIKSVTVAALVDLSAPAAKTGDKDKKDATAAASLTVKDAEEIIRSALGLSDANSIKVVNTPFFKSPESQEAQAAQVADAGFFNKDFLLKMAERGSLGLMVLGVLVMLKIFGSPSKKALEGGGAAALAGGTSVTTLPGPEGETDPDAVRARITRALQENPDEVKRLFLSWVESDKEEV